MGWRAWLWWRPPFVLRTVIVNLKDDDSTALTGVLWSVRGPWFTLRNGSVLKTGQAPTLADGELVIHRANIAFVQMTPA